MKNRAYGKYCRNSTQNVNHNHNGIASKTRMHSSRMCTARSSSRLLGDVCLSACWDTPLGLGLETPHPPGVGLETLPPARFLNLPTGCGPGDPPTRPPNLPPGSGPKHPPMNRITDTCKNITLPQLRCGR